MEHQMKSQAAEKNDGLLRISIWFISEMIQISSAFDFHQKKPADLRSSDFAMASPEATSGLLQVGASPKDGKGAENHRSKYGWWLELILVTSSTAQGGGGSFRIGNL